MARTTFQLRSRLRIVAAFAGAFVLSDFALAIDPARSLTQYMYETWTLRSGAPFGTINAITQTPDGYLWLGTDYDGLYKFDGVRFTRDAGLDQLYDRHGYRVNGLAADTEGTLWIATLSGVARRSRGQWTAIIRQPAPGIALTANGELLVAKRDFGMVRRRPGRTEMVSVQGHFVLVSDGQDGDVWAAGPEGLSRIRGSEVMTLTAEDGLGSNNVAALNLSASGDLWVGTRGGLNRVHDGRIMSLITHREGLPSDDVTAVLEDRDGAVWIGTGTDGMARLYNGRIETTLHGLPNASVTAFYEDREGSLWVATKGGLCRLTAGYFTPYGEVEGLGNDRAVSVIEGRDGSVWVWSDGGGLSRLKNDRVARVYTKQDGLASDFGGPIFESRDGAIWVGHDRGASRLKDGRITAYLEGSIAKGYVSCFAEDAAGLLTYVVGIGLLRFRDGKATPYPISAKSMTEPLPMPFMMRWTRDGTLWLGTAQGAWTLRDGELSRVWDRPEGIAMVTWIHEDTVGAIWLATWEGLYRLQNGMVGVVKAEHGLPHSRITHVLEDQQGYFWLSSPRGIARVQRQELEDVAAGRSERLALEVYGVADGIRSPESLGAAQPSGCATRDGRFWFVTNAGAVVVNPSDLKRNTLQPNVVIEDVLADGRSLGTASGILLRAGTTRIELQYTALSLRAPEKVCFKYRLEGLEDDWIDAQKRRVAHYTRLPPGEYRFRVIATNNDGVWNHVGASLDLTQLPHFHQTGWFYIALALTIAGLGVGVHRLRVRRHLRVEQELQARIREALAHITTLRGLLPICAWCNKIRDDHGYWSRIEDYLCSHTQAEFSHGICPDCMEKFDIQKPTL